MQLQALKACFKEGKKELKFLVLVAVALACKE
jgi:hypothetical protein